MLEKDKYLEVAIMYYHIVKKDGLKYKDLDIKEVDKIIKKDKLNFNNSRIYSSIKDLEHTFKIFEDEESKNLPQTLDRNEIRISDILSCFVLALTFNYFPFQFAFLVEKSEICDAFKRNFINTFK